MPVNSEKETNESSVNELSDPASNSRNQSILLLLLVVVVQFSRYFLDGNIGLSLMDEGYLWQGMDSVKAGLVPIRDFHAYDPGRYLWVAAWSFVFGDGLVAMRQSCVVFSIIGVFLGGLVCRRLSKSWVFLSAMVLILSIWMEPRFKAFEQSISLMVIYVATLLLEAPTRRRHFCSGIFVGALAVFGRNHAVYAALSLLILQSLLFLRDGKPQLRKFVSWSGGVALGFLPYGASIALIPGLFNAYIGLLKKDIESGTNLLCPVPWPWKIAATENVLLWSHQFIVGLCFVAIILNLLVAAGWITRKFARREDPLQSAVLVAAQAVLATYCHHAFSRPDLTHLSHVGAALTVGSTALISAFCTKSPKIGLWLGTSFTALLTLLSIGMTMGITAIPFSRSAFPIELDVRSEPMHVTRYHASLVVVGRYISENLMANDENIAFIPHTPGLYPATNRICPLYQSYFILPSSEAEQDATIQQLNGKRVNWILLQDIALDGRDDLRFGNTDKKVFKFIMQNFEPVLLEGMPPVTTLLKRKL